MADENVSTSGAQMAEPGCCRCPSAFRVTTCLAVQRDCSPELYYRISNTSFPIKKIIDLIQSHSPTAVVLLAKIIPTTFDKTCEQGEAVADRVKAFNEKLALLNAEQPGVVVVDFHRALNATDLRDGIHRMREAFVELYIPSLHPERVRTTF